MAISNYKNIRLLHLKDPVIGEFDNNFKIDNFISNENKNNFDIEIKNLIKNDKSNIDLVLLLRCKISHSIFHEIKEIHSKLSKFTALWTFTDILSWYLDDDGKRFIRKKSNLLQSFRKINRIDFNYFGIEKIIKDFEELKEYYFKSRKNNFGERTIKEIPRILPFCIKVIYTFDPEKNVKISTWVKTLLNTDNYLKKQIYPYAKIIFINNYSFLSKTPDEKIIDAWQRFGKINQYKTDVIKKILEDFREKYNKEKKRNYIPKENSKILKDLANALKLDQVPLYFHPQNNNNDSNNWIIEKNLQASYLNHEENSKKELDYFLKKWSEDKAKNTLKEILEKDMKKWNKDPGRRDAWIYLSKIDLNSKYQKNEYTGIASKCKSKKGIYQKVSWLSKVFRFEYVAREVWKYLEIKLKKITIDYVKDPERFIKNFEKKEGISITNSSLKIIKEKFYIGENKLSWGGYEYKTIFDDPNSILDFKEYDDIHNAIFRYINPKKSRKKLLIKLVNEILKEKDIINGD